MNLPTTESLLSVVKNSSIKPTNGKKNFSLKLETKMPVQVTPLNMFVLKPDKECKNMSGFKCYDPCRQDFRIDLIRGSINGKEVLIGAYSFDIKTIYCGLNFTFNSNKTTYIVAKRIRNQGTTTCRNETKKTNNFIGHEQLLSKVWRFNI